MFVYQRMNKKFNFFYSCNHKTRLNNNNEKKKIVWSKSDVIVKVTPMNSRYLNRKHRIWTQMFDLKIHHTYANM